ncbi:GCG_CRPN prefix-to-repeats domain-containing protein [Mesorhizobium sp. ORS 3428]|uniref:GCG_CRPN prefix-to-repeats domain-containing protein n=1 Tax=Mesorhizobium sp. ORS 3428 TaxID=540997 RepID=UPI0008DAA865|nr:hypothetical protein [Mesorhizobium sp. ORS 3428]OHV79126.1 hypothetical protein ORS3428_10280 [Mesorhizobium sp. ORS 3428]
MNGLTKYSVAAALALGGTIAAGAASAMPVAPVSPAPALVEHVAWGCGPGWHPNRWGRCVPNRRVIIYPRYYYWGGPYWGGPGLYFRYGPGWHRWHRW